MTLPARQRIEVAEVPVGSAAILRPRRRAPYPSSVVMGVVPAKVAGVGASSSPHRRGRDGLHPRPSSPQPRSPGRRRIRGRQCAGHRRTGARDQVDIRGRHDRRPRRPMGPGGQPVLAARRINDRGPVESSRSSPGTCRPSRSRSTCAHRPSTGATASWSRSRPIPPGSSGSPRRSSDQDRDGNPSEATFDLVAVEDIDAAIALTEALAPEHAKVVADAAANSAAADHGRLRLHGRALRDGVRRLRRRVEPRPADGRRGPLHRAARPGTFRRRISGSRSAPMPPRRSPGPSTRSPARRAFRCMANPAWPGSSASDPAKGEDLHGAG